MAERPIRTIRPAAADPARLVAWQVLRAVSADDAYGNLVLPRKLADAGLSGRDAALATELSYGTLRARGTLDEILRRCATRDLDDTEPAVLDLLRLGAYQLLKTRIPTHAAVATTVELAKTTGNARAAGFVNAILRKVGARDFDSWCELIAAGGSELGTLALRYSHPGWVVGAFAQVLPAEQLEAALAADDARPETHLVAWPGRSTAAELAQQSGGEAGPYSPFAVRLSHGGDPGSLAAVRDHEAGVQDEGSQLCALALTRITPIKGAEKWLDLCAGPGGKAALLAALAEQHGARLTANELHQHRAELVARATAGWPVTVHTGDARQLTGHFDRILLDAPCSGLGALRRRPEARWRRGPGDLAGLVELQAQLLHAAAGLLAPGGVLGYVTCSPHPAETRDRVQAVLAAHPELSLLDARAAFAGVDQLDGTDTVQLWPHRHGTDAMFFAALGKRA
ncbi:MAG TPA: transcription antitermination factor NusB [Jatrophihabitans sp.]|nr:transcription antitermination factor NusB [Jatrophihabitans sp.]